MTRIMKVEETQEVETQQEEPKEVEPKEVETEEMQVKETAPPPALAGNAVKSLEELRDVLPQMDFGTLTRLKSGSGDIVDSDGDSIGGWVDLNIMSFSETLTVSPNDDKAPNDTVRFSQDGKTIDGNPDITVADALRTMKEDYPESSVKKYYVAVGAVIGAEKSNDYDDTVIELQLSPQSIKAFNNHNVQVQFKVAMKKLSADCVTNIRFTATNRKRKTGGNYTILQAGFITS